MPRCETWALVPVKRFSQAKTRLREVLFDEERVRLAQTMLRDVLSNLRATSTIDGIAVVSSDPEVFAIARTFEAATILDTAEAGVRQAARCGLDAFRSFDRRVLVVPADIPFATPGDFEGVIALLDQTPIVLVPALYDGGTNALAMRSPDLLQPQYGEGSFRAHCDLARERRLDCSVLRSEGIGRDIDRPPDFEPYLSSPSPLGLTGSFLAEVNIAKRFYVEDAPAPVRSR